MIIVLIGYMGSGKSTIGKDLAKVLNYDFIDLDDYISEKENCAIPEMFKTKGEIYFRKQETKYLNELIETSNNIVLALGGGTPCYANNLTSILEGKNVSSFYLKLSIPHLTKRLFLEKDKRPLISHLSTTEELQEFIGKHLFERTQYYSKAHYTINTDNNSRQHTIEKILMHLI